MKVGNHVMKLNPHITQTNPKKEKYRVISVGKDPTQAPEYIGKIEKYCWVVTIKYLATNKTEKLFFDHYDKCYERKKN